jgi:dTDP-4-dehydrorhamnose reductase
VNAEAPQAMARWAALHGVPIVHFSTDYVFDGSGNRPFRENDTTGPLSAYGASKLAGEDAIRGAGGAFLIVRTSWVFSASGRNFLTTIARIARERQQLRVVADQVGAPTSARAIAQAVSLILANGSAVGKASPTADLMRQFGEANGVVHVTTKGEISWHGFACAIVEGMRKRGTSLAVNEIVAIDTKDFPTKASRPPNSRLSLNRLESLFGVQMPNWRDVLALELDAYCEKIWLSMNPGFASQLIHRPARLYVWTLTQWRPVIIFGVFHFSFFVQATFIVTSIYLTHQALAKLAIRLSRRRWIRDGAYPAVPDLTSSADIKLNERV